MITSLSELKELILWAKEQKVTSLEVGGVKFTLSETSLYELANLPDLSKAPTKLNAQASILDFEKTMSPEEEEDLLFHSARP